MTPVGTPNPFVMECHPTYYHPTLIRNILIIIWLKPKRCNSFNFPFIRGQVEKKMQIADYRVCPCLMNVGLPNCHPIDYHPTLIKPKIIIWLKPERCNSFNIPLIRFDTIKTADFAPCLMTPVGTPNPFVMECHPTYCHPTLIRNSSIVIWLKPKRCNKFSIYTRTCRKKMQIADFAYVRV